MLLRRRKIQLHVALARIVVVNSTNNCKNMQTHLFALWFCVMENVLIVPMHVELYQVQRYWTSKTPDTSSANVIAGRNETKWFKI
jgi:hypothetical protein